MTIYTMILEKVVVLTDTVEIEADSLEEAKELFEENECDYFEEADFDFPLFDDPTLIRPYLFGATWIEDGNEHSDSFVRIAAELVSESF